MKSQDFCNWLSGFLTLRDENKPITNKQIQIIRNHLNMVFAYEIDPSFGNKQEELNKIHNHTKENNPATNPLAGESRTWDAIFSPNSDIEYMC